MKMGRKQKVAHWIREESKEVALTIEDTPIHWVVGYHCSNCDSDLKNPPFLNVTGFNFCPNCGKPMDSSIIESKIKETN